MLFDCSFGLLSRWSRWKLRFRSLIRLKVFSTAPRVEILEVSVLEIVERLLILLVAVDLAFLVDLLVIRVFFFRYLKLDRWVMTQAVEIWLVEGVGWWWYVPFAVVSLRL